MPDTWGLDDLELDVDAIRHDEAMATAMLALVALRRGQKPPTDTPLQRMCASVVRPIWANREVRAKLHKMRLRAGH